MLRCFQFALIACLLTLAGCNPTFNWREIRLAQSVPLKALLPCKPDRGSRPLVLAAQTLTVHMAGCEAGEALFAIAYADLPEAAPAMLTQQHWQQAVLANMQAQSSAPTGISIPGAHSQPPPVQVHAQGRRTDGRAVSVQAVWFAQGGRLYHAAVYADRLNPDVAQTFLSGLRFE